MPRATVGQWVCGGGWVGGWVGEEGGGGRVRGGEKRGGREEGAEEVVVVVRTMCYACMSVHARTRMHLIEMDQCQCTGPFGWTYQPEPPYACSLRRQVPGAPPPHHLLSFGGREAQSFPSPRRWMPWIQKMTKQYTWTCLPGEPHPLNTVTTIIGQTTRSNIPSFTTTISNPG